MNLETIGQQARQASYALAMLSSQKKNEVLQTVAQCLRANQDLILKANDQDMEKGKQQNRKSTDFTVCTEDQLPDEVKTLIEQKKETTGETTNNKGE